jgi:hypothetical protein
MERVGVDPVEEGITRQSPFCSASFFSDMSLPSNNDEKTGATFTK